MGRSPANRADRHVPQDTYRAIHDLFCPPRGPVYQPDRGPRYKGLHIPEAIWPAQGVRDISCTANAVSDLAILAKESGEPPVLVPGQPPLPWDEHRQALYI